MARIRMVPLLAAAILTGLNAVKDVVVDDTAYLFFAQHIAEHPGDPYGFMIDWYDAPEPAMHVLAPPVVPYWLAAGMALFGENLLLLKLWLFPIALLFTCSVDALLGYFAAKVQDAGVIMLAGCGTILPMLNFMLDIPALALGAAALALFIRSSRRSSWRGILLAGLLAGAAMQTKYTMLTIPVAIVLYSLLAVRRPLAGLIAGMVALGSFTSWEVFVASRSGESHFLYHFRQQSAKSEQDETQSLLGRQLATIMKKWDDLGLPFVVALGFCASGWGIVAAPAVGFGRRFPLGVALAAAFGLGVVATLPYADSVLLRSPGSSGMRGVRLDLPTLYGTVFGTGLLVTLALAVVRLLIVSPTSGRSLGFRRDPTTLFLVVWLLMEIGSYFVLSPFTATRRICPSALVMALLLLRVVALFGEQLPRWSILFVLLQGSFFQSLDIWDARVDRIAVERAVAIVATERIANGPGRNVWTLGHWGWQYYTDRAGFQAIDDSWSPSPGDFIVVPVLPDDGGFHRPDHGRTSERNFNNSMSRLVGEVVVDDAFKFQTIPNFYGGGPPLRGRNHPRLVVRIYRVVAPGSED